MRFSSLIPNASALAVPKEPGVKSEQALTSDPNWPQLSAFSRLIARGPAATLPAAAPEPELRDHVAATRSISGCRSNTDLPSLTTLQTFSSKNELKNQHLHPCPQWRPPTASLGRRSSQLVPPGHTGDGDMGDATLATELSWAGRDPPGSWRDRCSWEGGGKKVKTLSRLCQAAEIKISRDAKISHFLLFWLRDCSRRQQFRTDIKTKGSVLRKTWEEKMSLAEWCEDLRVPFI